MTPDDGSHQQPVRRRTPLGVLRAELLAAVREVAAGGARADARERRAGRSLSAAGAAGGGRPDDARAPPAGGVRRLLDQRRAAAGARPGHKPARARGAPRGRAEGAAGGELERFEVAGPGFLNLFLADAWLTAALAQLLAADPAHGAGGARRAADPGGIRLGQPDRPDARRPRPQRRLRGCARAHARRLRTPVEREFYVNDAGSQMRKLGESVSAVARGQEPARGRLPRRLRGRARRQHRGRRREDPVELGRAAVALMVAGISDDAGAPSACRPFDQWSYESALHEGDPSPVESALAALKASGHTYTSEGALWLRTTDFGDDKDRVLIRSNGEHTYFASDIAYHEDRRERGLPAPDQRLGSRPPRLRQAHEGRLRGARRRPRRARAADHAARAPAAGRGARADVKAGGGVRDAR